MNVAIVVTKCLLVMYKQYAKFENSPLMTHLELGEASTSTHVLICGSHILEVLRALSDHPL